MKKELELQLVNKYPKLFQEYGMTPDKSCMSWGCDCGDGWYKLIDDLCEKLSEYEVVLSQVKEKFGKLRVYINGCNEDDFHTIQNIIDDYEDKSGTICEHCGKPGTLRGKGWLTTSCDKCEQKK